MSYRLVGRGVAGLGLLLGGCSGFVVLLSSIQEMDQQMANAARWCLPGGVALVVIGIIGALAGGESWKIWKILGPIAAITIGLVLYFGVIRPKQEEFENPKPKVPQREL